MDNKMSLAALVLAAATAIFMGYQMAGQDDDGATMTGPGAEVSSLADKLDAISTDMSELRNELREARTERDAARGTIARLEERIDELSLRGATPASAEVPANLSADAADAGGASADLERRKRDFRKLMKEMFKSGLADEEKMTKFFADAKDAELLGEIIADMEAAVEGDPSNIGGRLDLAQAYVAKLWTLPSGPEQGIWGGKAMEQWNDVLELDENNWEAQISVAFSYSMYPDFLNKTQDAIDGFARTIEIQDSMPPRDDFADTYVHLARMHAKQGNREKAREILQAGKGKYPGNKEIEKALRSYSD